MARGGIPRTKERYNTVLAAFRQLGVKFTQVSKLVGLHRHTVQQLYSRGWPDREGCLPIKKQLEMDQLIIRAARANADPEEQVAIAQQVLGVSLGAARETALDAADMLGKAALKAQEMQERATAMLADAEKKLEAVEELARLKVSDAEKAALATLQKVDIEAKQRMAKLLADAKVDAAETLADEANAAKFGRKAAMSAVAIAALVLRDAQTIAKELQVAITGKISTLSPLQAMRVAREMVRLVEAAEKSVILALQAERLRVGQPTEILGIQSADASIEEKEIKLRAVARAIQKQKQKLHLVQGGVNAVVGAGGTGTDGAQPEPGGVAGGNAAT